MGPVKEDMDTGTWTPRVCKIMAFWAVFNAYGLLFYILWGSRYRYRCRYMDAYMAKGFRAPLEGCGVDTRQA